MHSFEAKIEKMKPAFEKIASNPYVSAIRDGFIAAMPIILFSSIFTLIAYVPNAWGFYWSKAIENALMLPYNYSMGLLALFVTATTAKNLTDYKNLNLPKVNQINPISVIMAAEISFFIVAVKTANGGVDLSFMGTKGLIAAYVVGLNVDANQALLHAGKHACHVLAINTQDYVMNMGGTGSTFVLAFIFLLLAKSKQNKAVGKASFIPVTFSVNEPILFGAPIIMNPVFFVPFVLTPIVNICMFKFFVTTLGMNSMVATMPWTIPAPIGIIVATGFAPLSFLYVALALILDVLIWLPFFRAYDDGILKEEQAKETEELAAVGEASVQDATASETSETTTPSESNDTITQDTNVLVICAGGGTSGILAKALNKTAEERNLPLHAAARAYGQHNDIINDMDLVILAPQMDSMRGNLQKICDHNDIKLLTTTGKQYIELTRDADKAIRFVAENTH